ncbi:hypothetical protein [Pseudomonas sp. LB3P25]
MKFIFSIFFMCGFIYIQNASAECYGEGDYEVCSEVETDADGDIHAESWDTEGNTYSVDTETRAVGNGHEVKSSDSEGNEYSIKSWSDSSGAHSVDSDGNSCTITPAGTMIGCD